MNSTFDAANGYMWNVSVPAGLSGAAYAKIGDRIVGQSISLKNVATWGLDLSQGSEGRLLFNHVWEPQATGLTITRQSAAAQEA